MVFKLIKMEANEIERKLEERKVSIHEKYIILEK